MQPISYVTFFIATLALLNPIGKIAVLMSLTEDLTPLEIKKTVFTSSVAVFFILLISLWVGADILKVFGVSIGGFTTAGGLLVLLIGLNMVQATFSQQPIPTDKTNPHGERESIAVVPLAIPLVAGPGAIASVILHSYHNTVFYQRVILSGVCFALTLIVFLCMYFAPPLSKILGEHGIKICTRIIGIITSALGIQMIAAGLILLFPILGLQPPHI